MCCNHVAGVTSSRRPDVDRDRCTEEALRSRARFSLFVLGTLAIAALPGCAPLVVGGAATTAVVAASQERGLGGAISDTEIQAQINHYWFQHSVEMHSRLGMTVNQGTVLLTGRARTPEERLDAVRLAWQANGVREVINEIVVDDASTLGDSTRDTWISTQLRGKLLFDREVSSINYSIETVNGVVYLMGNARDPAELERVTGHARSLPYVKRVVSYVR
ncbi:BON domain-containing protein [Skermanella sp. TT6]|uniref:BON domain-containing protein n=1 Tax=Skermanella cutis TaxID=2775420 RepID=A0ABX7BBT0_9PROT|nr:BON domain-containing protein [Skermanella sp. TT6]